MALTKVPREFSTRYLNEGFSGGEKKRMEILQLALLAAAGSRCSTRPTPASTSTRSTGRRRASTPSPRRPAWASLIITHYQRILHIVQPAVRAHHVRGADRQGGRPRAGRAARARGLRLDPRRGGRGGMSLLAPRSATDFPILDAHGRRLPRLRRDVAEAAPRDRGDGRLLPRVPREHPPRHLPARGRGHRALRGRARQGRRLHRLVAAARPSSPATPPRRSTSSPTRGAGATSRAGDASS